MATTQINPGSHQPYKFKSWRSIISSVKTKIKQRHFKAAYRAIVADGLNNINEKNILSGESKYCPVCKNKIGRFMHLGNELRFSWNSVCPHCSSRSRHRGLLFFYEAKVNKLNSADAVMHFAPEPIFYPLFENYDFKYETSDYFLDDVTYPKEDIQNLSFSDNTYKLVLCNHVIEHVPDDLSALKEMERILVPGGAALITVPGDYTRQDTIYFDHLEFNGHYRDYGLDFKNKMESVFSSVEMVDLHQFDKGKHGIRKHELVFVGYKNKK